MLLSKSRLFVIVVVLLCLPSLALIAQQRGKKPVRRAKHPEFNRSTTNLFYPDIFAEGGPLEGPRPSSASVAPTTGAPSNGGGSSDTPASSGGGGIFAWGKIISPATIENEVKAIKVDLDKDITRPSSFTGGGNRKCQTHFSVLAMLFAIIGEYDGEVRWKKDGPQGRELFARVARNCKTNTRTVFDEAKKRKDDLQELVGGGGLDAKEAEAAADWSTVADRTPLMKKLEIVMAEKLQPWTANANDFKTNSDEILYQAELVAAIGEVLTREGMEDAGDEDYDAFAKRMRDAGRQIVDGVKLKNHDEARKGVGEISKACSECHESYRG